ncbi:probable U3 small nucleolar RNA-associated protein 11 [Amaranthus tricolor]|uniref:probable U3 small nucleolar RNA-associated protein 11 n=1 Tax=Amaranthus tricolor TaxID=29722 RepID=UPI00258E9CD2|nr:probable U3 small nucleolar RNA-associated protein 11 [Amaranthus tricolor]
MSSIRNAIPKRTYKERSQPASRKKFGFLEKHKDYVIRAREYHKKEETLRILKEKAANRNPDEFYFGMIRTKTINGVHRPESEANKYTPEELSLMKTQDIGYVLQKLQIEKKKVEKLKATLHNLDNQPSNRHIYFAEDRFVIESFGFGGVAEQELFFSSCRLSELFPFQFYFWFNTCE